jgi:uncharacterized protein (TIGR02231 family)
MAFIKTLLRIVLTIFLFYSLHLQAQDNKVSAKESIQEVILYLNGAEIKTNVSLNLKKGRNDISIEGLSPFVQDKSIQVAEKSSAEMLSISTKEYIVKIEDFNSEFKMQNDSLELLQRRMEQVNNEIDAYNVEKNTLFQNQQLSRNATVTVPELSKAADFFRERTLKINTTLSLLNTRRQKLNLQLEELQREVVPKKSQNIRTRKKLAILLISPIDQQVKLEVRYLVDAAGWSPSYDLIATDITKPITLKYKANILNNTGISWKDVKVTLATSDPSLNATRPYLTTWNLNYESSANEGLVENKGFAKAKSKPADSTLVYEEIAVSELNTTFPIERPYSISSDGLPFTIEIKTVALNATYEYLTIPKVDLTAFLIAKVTGWENLNLIEGMANIYFADTYVGESRINTRFTSDTLELSLGRDNQILVTRSKIVDAGDKKLIGLKKTESLKYEIQVKNNRSSPIVIKIQDQIPVSQESEITVDAEQISGAALDTESGRLQWIPKIMPGEKASYIVAFSVKYPRSKEVAIRKKRIVRTPRYMN